MPKVELKVRNAIKGLIEAPDFCPFKQNEEVDIEVLNVSQTARGDGLLPSYRPIYAEVVNASICQLCKLCEFYTGPAADVLTSDDYAQVEKVLTANKEILTTVVNQVKFLQKQERIPLLVIVSFETLKNVVYQALDGPLFDKKLSVFVNTKAPICLLAGLPVYFSDKLTRCAVQVVGEVDWAN
jgi:hypothetical protein